MYKYSLPSYQGTPPFMTIEAFLAIDRTFVHQPQHDLKSILYIILYICTLVRGPGLPLLELDATHHVSPPICTWFCNDAIRKIGYHKLAHLQRPELTILPYFTPYWCDFTPFVKDLIVLCFLVKASLPITFQYDQALQILTMA